MPGSQRGESEPVALARVSRRCEKHDAGGGERDAQSEDERFDSGDIEHDADRYEGNPGGGHALHSPPIRFGEIRGHGSDSSDCRLNPAETTPACVTDPEAVCCPLGASERRDGSVLLYALLAVTNYVLLFSRGIHTWVL
ncbi:hypothetical protein ACFQH2_14895 [Natronoarchaeum sp. GCM10025703]|uniref:hypothetical protein n=1 Tax=Natronoarchaeum sp. GCM10025703 TaxID=3252685 RepID=UPI003615A51D